MLQASIPSPSSGVLELGPFPLRAYAVCIIIGVLVCVVISDRRWVARGGRKGTFAEVATFAVPAGVVGARIYHVITSYELYQDRPLDMFKIWEGGLGIWGAVIGGALGAWLYTRRHGIRFAPFADAIAPGLAVAQAIGRLGNWFNQELFGRPTDLPWALEIEPENRPAGYLNEDTFHPTFLYELLWNLGVAGLVLWADRRFRLGRGRAFALYVAAYCAGRLWIELLRIDTANEFFGLRLNVFTSVIVFVLAVSYLLLRRGPRETVVQVPAEGESDDAVHADSQTVTPAHRADRPAERPDRADDADS